jgi:hypothetical protein
MASKKDKVAQEQQATDEQLDRERDVSTSSSSDPSPSTSGGSTGSETEPGTTGSDVATDSDSGDQGLGNVQNPSEERDQMSDEEFREQQKAQAVAQGMTDERAVPESRTPAFSDSSATESDVVKRQREAGLIDQDPMPKSAYDKAASEGQLQTADENSRQEAIHVGAMVRVINEDSPHFGRNGAVVRAIYSQGAYAARSGQPEQRFIEAEEFEVRSRGDAAGDQTMMLRPDELEIVARRDWTSLGAPVGSSNVMES